MQALKSFLLLLVAWFLGACEARYDTLHVQETLEEITASNEESPDDDSGSNVFNITIGMGFECYGKANCLFVDGEVLGNEPFAAFVGVYYGNPNVDPDELKIEDLDTQAFQDDAAIGWAMDCNNELDIGHAVPLKNGHYSLPLSAVIVEDMDKPFPSGVYRMELRMLATIPRANDFDGPTMAVDCEEINEPDTEVLSENWYGVWSGYNEAGEEDRSIVFAFDASTDHYDLEWSKLLPIDLQDL